jgi:hypothetical protein
MDTKRGRCAPVGNSNHQLQGLRILKGNVRKLRARRSTDARSSGLFLRDVRDLIEGDLGGRSSQ